jgi:predicted GNAT family acetyltransferase
MSEVQIKIGESGNGDFLIEENGERIALMHVNIHGTTLTAMHTEVAEQWKKHGLGNKLVEAMAEYARANKLKVKPLCPYTRVIFERYPERYGDLWNGEA